MAPEQFGSGAIDKRCDIHAAGTILYELLTGRSPFAGEADGLTAVFRVLNFVPPPPSQVRPGLAPAFDRVVQRALAKSPAERFATAGEFRDELRSAYSALMRRPPPDTLVRSVFASQMPPAPAARPAGADASLTSPLPEQLFIDKAAARAAEAAPRSAPEKAAAPARAATPVPPDAPLPGSTLPGTRSAPSPPAPGAREVTSRSLRADAPARASDAQKGNGRLEPPKVSESAPPAKESGARSTPTRLEGAPAKAPGPASPPSDLKDLISAAIPVPPLTSQGARAKEPGKPAPVSGGTVLAPPKRAVVAEPPPAPAKEAKKDEPAPGGTVLAPAKRTAGEPEKARPASGGTRLPPPRGAASEPVAEDLVGEAIPVESVLASQPKAPEPPAARAAAAEAAAPPPQAAPGEPSSEDELSETQQAKKFERTIWIPTPKDDSGLWRGPPPPKSPAPAPEVTEDESVVSTPPPKAPVQKKVVPLTDAAIAHGGKVLARFMGPIAMVLSRRAAQDLKDEKAFFDALASHLTDPDERYQFLREVRQRPG
jgi:serine/threonine-protein kinase